MIITLKTLEQHGACEAQRTRFERVFPNGAKVNITNALKAAKNRFSIGWAASNFLTVKEFDRWNRESHRSYTAYNKAKIAAEKTYNKATKNEERTFTAYSKIRDRASKRRDEAIDAAYAAYGRAEALAFVEAVKRMEKGKK